MASLRMRGCKALHYRLTGEDLIERLCVVHLAGTLRVVVAFESAEAAVILLAGPHRDDDPFIDVYLQLYELAGLDEPPIGRRTKPPCCDADNSLPPVVDSRVLDDLVRRARELSGAAKRRARRSGKR